MSTENQTESPRASDPAVGSSDWLGGIQVRTLGSEPSGWNGFELRQVEICIGAMTLRGKIRCSNDAGPLGARWAFGSLLKTFQEAGWDVKMNELMPSNAD